MMLCYEGLISVLLEIISNDFCLCAFCVFACVFVPSYLAWICLPLLIRLMEFDLKSLKTCKSSEGTTRQTVLLMIVFVCVNKHPLCAFFWVLCSKFY